METYLVVRGAGELNFKATSPSTAPSPVATGSVDTGRKRERDHETEDEGKPKDKSAASALSIDLTKRRSGGNPTKDPNIVMKWTFEDKNAKDIGNCVWGFHSKQLPKDLDRKNRAISLIKRNAQVRCWWCGATLAALKATVAVHVKTETCLKKREEYLRKVTEQFQSGTGGHVDPLWEGISMWPTVVIRPQSLPGTVQRDPVHLRALLVTTAAAKGLSFRNMDDLFSKESAFRRGLRQLDGLGSDKTCAVDLGQEIEKIHNEDVRPVFRYAVTNDLPICIASDESPAKGRAVLLAHVFHPGLKETLCIDVKQMHRACNYDRLIQGLKDVVIGNNFLSSEEWTKHVVIFSGDHAAYVIKAAREANCEHAGDPAHAFDLVIKAIIKACHLKPLFMSLRKIFTSKSYVITALMKAVNLNVGGVSVMKLPATRWGYVPRLLRMLSVPKELAKLQEALLWILHNMFLGPASLPTTSLQWMHGVPFKPETFEVFDNEYSDSSDEDWGDDREVEEENEEEVEGKIVSEEEDVVDNGVSVKSVQARGRTTCIQLLAVLTNPQVFTFIRIISRLVEPLRTAQVLAQGQKVNGDFIQAFQNAYKTFSEPLVNFEAFDAWARVPFGDSAPTVFGASTRTDSFSLRANFEKNPDGAMTITNMPTSPLFSIMYDESGAKKAWKQVLNEVRPPIKEGAKQYEKVVYKCFYVAQRRFLASLQYDLGPNTTSEVKRLLYTDDALPPRLRTAEDKTRTIVTNADIDWNDDTVSRVPKAKTISDQWDSLMVSVFNSESTCYMKVDDKADPHKFWMRVREHLPELGNTMLYWLAHPVGTAGLERDFSGMTIECRNFRFSRQAWPAFRARLLARCYKPIVDRKLLEALAPLETRQ